MNGTQPPSRPEPLTDARLAEIRERAQYYGGEFGPTLEDVDLLLDSVATLRAQQQEAGAGVAEMFTDLSRALGDDDETLVAAVDQYPPSAVWAVMCESVAALRAQVEAARRRAAAWQEIARNPMVEPNTCTFFADMADDLLSALTAAGPVGAPDEEEEGQP